MKKLIVANWKCNPTSAKEAEKMLSALSRGVAKIKNELVVCPPYVYLFLAKKIIGQKMAIGSQNCFWQNQGAFTGEISALMLKDIGVKYVIVGHSERRLLGETSEIINQKLLAVLKAGLKPIFCCGETKEQKENNQTFQIIEEQIISALLGVAKNNLSKVIIAYEPVWAIGAKKACPADTAITTALFIRKLLGQMAGKKQVSSLKVLYGGSLSADNAIQYLTSQWIDGLLIGGASLDIKELLTIAKTV